ncbi:Uncharacterised protein [uncultured Leptotrichia sp.]|uniref:hypothetical protein n=1 Tax=uncultured Leptotrichia sp. TaxID=159271 RepID=UPI001A5CE3CE|nr:hypothetical protein [uncultured Leptotrichia sp.]VTX50673.1 Uncharacterised protein [uncultured Leptotrichia sp.]
MLSKKEVFIKAWKRFRSLVKNGKKVIFADCLRYAWDYFKSFEKKDVVFAELEGSEKQKKWAKSIQKEVADELIRERCCVVSRILKIKRQAAAKVVKFFLANERRSWILIDLGTTFGFENEKIWENAFVKYQK